MTSEKSFLLALPSHKTNYFNKLLSKRFPECKIYDFPVLNLNPIKDLDFDDYLNEYDWLILLSSYCAEIFFEKTTLKDINIKIATVGPSVSNVVVQSGYGVAVQAKTFNAQGLASELKRLGLITNNRFLLITGSKSNSQSLIDEIEIHKGCVEKFIVYESQKVLEPNWNNFNEFLSDESKTKFVCVTSPEGMKNLYDLLLTEGKEIGDSVQIVCLGPATKEAVCKLFPKIKSHCAEEYSYNGMLSLIEKFT